MLVQDGRRHVVLLVCWGSHLLLCGILHLGTMLVAVRGMRLGGRMLLMGLMLCKLVGMQGAR